MEILGTSSTVVLVVEDNLLIRMGFVAMIEDAGIEVLEASNADEAIVVLEARADVTVMFTDIEMPGSMDGLKLAFAVRDRWPPITLIIASGRVPPRTDEMPIRTTFLRKPYTEAAVIEAVQHVA